MRFLWLGLWWLGFCFPQAGATVICQGAIEQPINLAGASDPASIPLGLAAYESNHGYGIQAIITAPRPCLHGAMTWKNGTELDQNLAHVFGISVEFEDSTQVTAAPVVIHVKAQPPPPYSPYTKGQVVAATLHCLLRSVSGTPDHPVIIQLETDDPADQQWAKEYEGKYITGPGSDNAPVMRTPVAGTRLETDVYGVTHVVFPAVRPRSAVPARSPVLIPFFPQGENDETTYILFPVWVGDTWNKPLAAIGEPYGLFHDLWRGQGSNEVNVLFHSGNAVEWGVDETPEKTAISIHFMELSKEDLAAVLYATIFSVQPTADKPLEITLSPYANLPLLKSRLLGNPGWADGELGNQDYVSCVFVLEPKTRKLLRGSVPGVTVTDDGSGGIWLVRDEPTPADKDAERDRERYEWMFKQQAFDQAEPTLEEFRKFAPEGTQEGLVWEFWRAGYREAFLAYREYAKFKTPPAGPRLDSYDPLAQTRYSGWLAGNGRGFKVATGIWQAYQKEGKEKESPKAVAPDQAPLPGATDE